MRRRETHTSTIANAARRPAGSGYGIAAAHSSGSPHGSARPCRPGEGGFAADNESTIDVKTSHAGRKSGEHRRETRKSVRRRSSPPPATPHERLMTTRADIGWLIPSPSWSRRRSPATHTVRIIVTPTRSSRHERHPDSPPNALRTLVSGSGRVGAGTPHRSLEERQSAVV